MTIIRTTADLTRQDVRRLKRGRYEILAIKTHHLAKADVTEILWYRDERPDAIQVEELRY